MISVGFKTLMYREVYRFMRLFTQTVVPPIVTTMLYILIFGVSLGNRIGKIHDFPYVLYILPGLAQMGLINGAFSNSSFSLFQAKMERSIENLLTSPLNYFQITLGYVFGGVVRGLTIGICTLAVSAIFVRFPFEHIFILIFAWVGSAFFFSCMGVIAGVYAKTWDKMSNIQTFLLTPLIYLGGAFYSIDMLPTFWRNLTQFNPIFYSVDLTRHGLLGVSDLEPVYAMTVLLILCGAAFSLAVVSFRRGTDWMIH